MIHLYEVSKVVKPIEIEKNGECQGLGRGENEKLVLSEHKVSVM
jgi:hypothetical protein